MVGKEKLRALIRAAAILMLILSIGSILYRLAEDLRSSYIYEGMRAGREQSAREVLVIEDEEVPLSGGAMHVLPDTDMREDDLARQHTSTMADTTEPSTIMPQAPDNSQSSSDPTETCPECIGWITLDGTAIDLPVVRCTAQKDQSYWLTHLVNGEKNRTGSIFLDSRCSDLMSEGNTIIYGHNLKNGRMFRCLRNYLLEPGFYETHPVFTLSTSDAEYRCIIFAAAEVGVDSPLYTVDVVSAAAVVGAVMTEEEYLHEISPVNRLDPLILPGPGSRYVTLSTCSYGFDNARLLIIAFVQNL